MKNSFTILLLILFCTSIYPSNKIGNQEKVKANRIDTKIILDGKLLENSWNLPAMEQFTQRDPKEGNPPTERTQVWVGYDDEYVYVAAKLHDSNPSEIDASLARRDNWIDSDWFVFYVDPYFDRRTGYYFGVNAGGSLTDGTLYNDSWNDDSWDGIWEAKTNVMEDGWCVEMRIPFSQLRFKESDDMKWGINFQRSIKRNNEEDYFIMVPKEESGFVSHFATLEGLKGIQPKQRIEVLPYLVQKAQYLRHDSGDPFYKGNQYKTTLGADLKLGIGTNLNVDVTINPDFGQVEVDPAVVNLSAFETFFPEKRPFFIEGSNIFSFASGGANNNWGFNFGNPTLFYSRRIGRSPQGNLEGDYVDYPNESRILGAAKLSGKIDETWSIGALSAVTERTYGTSSLGGVLSDIEVEPLTHYGVFRTRKEMNDGKQAVGMIFTSVNRDLRTQELTDILSKQAYTFGVDGWSFLDDEEEYIITAYAVGSYVSGSKEFMQNLQQEPYRYYQRPDKKVAKYDESRTSLTGLYSRVQLNKQKGNFYVNSALGIVTPGFDYNDLGFQWNADKINAHLVMGYRWYEPDSIFRRKWIYAAHAQSYNFDGDNISSFFMTFMNFQFLNYWGLNMQGWHSLPTLNQSATRGGPLVKEPVEYEIYVSGYTDSRKELTSELDFSIAGDAIGGSAYSIGYDLLWKPNSQINVSVGPSYSFRNNRNQWVTNIEDDFAVNTFGNRYIFAELKQETFSGNIRLNWTFSPTLSLQLYFQPLLAIGDYTNLKELAKPSSAEYNRYGENGSTIEYDVSNEEYRIDPDGNGAASEISVSNPNFNFKSLRGNVILRWEVDPGSILYFVWSHDKVNFDDPGELKFGRDFGNLWNSEPNNIFLVKFSYWFNM
ncbi:MAG: carbohydrate binding family 9 domain-containing protein [Melioribacteraceae bacterium]|nr:carbohydrate binding family 9 domain-containing protein [Melioribacteraceae bacterium]MCF8265099.1 carbohydrate binding family 9 domain-containing protein [Melioribacteraceae bacterium]MCF8413218.1 carbohydrate binding family 9 domain-containing protein [Melioribacteraceae bacterium]MCF8431185.1 carbohydrate binding family 9 domain-containing protein [Melioribacteraceae bacterium]